MGDEETTKANELRLRRVSSFLFFLLAAKFGFLRFTRFCEKKNSPGSLFFFFFSLLLAQALYLSCLCNQGFSFFVFLYLQ